MLFQHLNRIGFDDIVGESAVFEYDAGDVAVKLLFECGDCRNGILCDIVIEADDECAVAKDIRSLTPDIACFDRESQVETVFEEDFIEEIFAGAVGFDVVHGIEEALLDVGEIGIP